MYSFYFDYNKETIQLPVPPQNLTLKVNGRNKTIELLNLGEVNILKAPGLSEFNFKIILPGQPYPFATYTSGFKEPRYFLERFEKYKLSKKPLRFIVSRVAPWGRPLFDTNMLVSLENYTIEEDAGAGGDIHVDLQLKQYKDYATQTVKLKKVTASKAKATTSTKRPTARTTPKTHKVVRGDTLWGIARKYLGNGNRWREIYNINKSKIKNPNLIYPGQVFKLP